MDQGSLPPRSQREPSTSGSWKSALHPASDASTSIYPANSSLDHASRLRSAPGPQQTMALSSTQPGHYPLSSQSRPSSSHAVEPAQNQWGDIFSAPLNPSMFAALAANGVLGPPPSHPNNLPSALYHNNYPSNGRQIPHIDPNAPSHSSGQWTDPPINGYAPSSGYPPKPPLSRAGSSAGNIHLQRKPDASLPFSTHTQSRSMDKPPSSSDSRRYGPRGRNSVPTPSVPHHLRTDMNRGGDARGGMSLQSSPLDYIGSNAYPFPAERPQLGLPPSLWMSPASTAPPTPAALEPIVRSPVSATQPPTSATQSSIHPSLSPTSPTDSRSTVFTDIFSENIFQPPNPSTAASPFTSPRLSGSPDLLPTYLQEQSSNDPEKMAKEDPLAAQVWRMYAKTRATLPHAQRMENLTWRMMAVTLKKQKDEEEGLKSPQIETKKQNSSMTVIEPKSTTLSNDTQIKAEPDSESPAISGERGRRLGKEVAQVRVVGFDGTNQDEVDE